MTPDTATHPNPHESFFAHARSALTHGLVQLGLRPGDAILVPDYICAVVTDAVEASGFECRYYPVSDQLEPIPEALDNQLDSRIKALLIVHYFGHAQNVKQWQQFARKRGIFLIEDNAHGFGGRHAGQLLGTFGDIGIASPRKFLPIRNGGVLYWNRPERLTIPTLSTQPGAVAWKTKQLLKRILASWPSLYSCLRHKPNYLDPYEGVESVPPPWAIDHAGLDVMCLLDLAPLIQARQVAWRAWHLWAAKQGLQPVFDTLEDGLNPWCYVARVPGELSRRHWFDWGWRNRIDVSSWPALPRTVIAQQMPGYDHWSSILRFAIPAVLKPQELEERLHKAG